MNSLIYQGHTYTVEATELTVAQIRVLAQVPTSNVIILEGLGAAEDRVLQDNDVVSLQQGPVRLFSKPPTSFGAFDALATH